jgi:hypothetical protein
MEISCNIAFDIYKTKRTGRMQTLATIITGEKIYLELIPKTQESPLPPEEITVSSDCGCVPEAKLGGVVKDLIESSEGVPKESGDLFEDEYEINGMIFGLNK